MPNEMELSGSSSNSSSTLRTPDRSRTALQAAYIRRTELTLTCPPTSIICAIDKHSLASLAALAFVAVIDTSPVSRPGKNVSLRLLKLEANLHRVSPFRTKLYITRYSNHTATLAPISRSPSAPTSFKFTLPTTANPSSRVQHKIHTHPCSLSVKHRNTSLRSPTTGQTEIAFAHPPLVGACQRCVGSTVVPSEEVGWGIMYPVLGSSGTAIT